MIKDIKTGKPNKTKPVFYTSTGIGIGSTFRSTSSSPLVEVKMLTAEDIVSKTKPKICKRLLPKNTMLGEYFRYGVYLLYYQKEVVYVGQSMCPYQRIYQHRDKKLFDEFRILHCSAKRVLYWENKLINCLQPKLNKAIKKSR
jgi:hypothetical protein|tara:strand:+ start:245 stop:673 length:429 start_codon:yes stop_codon:yes gene_type:complete